MPSGTSYTADTFIPDRIWVRSPIPSKTVVAGYPSVVLYRTG